MHNASPTKATMNRGSERSGFRPDIEGLRAVAVVAVVLFHAQVPGVGGGFVGVDVFFVISGFLITGLLWREASSTGTVRLRGFYGARARRLLPASAAVGIATMIASALLLPPLEVPTVLQDGIASALYISNYWFIARGADYFNAFSAPSPFLHYWSLGVEEQFYLVWPALILATAWLIRRLRRVTTTRATASQRPYQFVLTLICLLSFALSFAVCQWAPFVAFFSLPTRAWQLALGGLVALTSGRWGRMTSRTAAVTGWSGLAMILVACTWLSATTLYPGTAALLPTLGAVLVIGAGCATAAQGAGRILGLSPIRAIGRISYSWYLWHWPVLLLVPVLLGHPLGLPARLAMALASAALAALTLRFIENPLRFAPRVRNSPRRSLALGALATAAAVAVGAVALVAIPTPVGRGAPAAQMTITAARVPTGSNLATYDETVRRAFAQVRAAVAASADLEAVPSNLDPPLVDAAAEVQATHLNGCLRTPFESGQPECASGNTASTTTVALIGDSHAAMWYPALLQIATQRQWRLEVAAKAACAPMDLPFFNPALNREYIECGQWRDQILARLQAERPRLVVISMSRRYGGSIPSYGPAWLDSIPGFVQRVRATGAQVLVLGPVPAPQSAVPICLSAHLQDATACSPSRSVAVDETGIAAEAAATKAGDGHYADLTELFCTTERCPVIVGNTLVYFDDNHLTLEYSRLLAPVIGALADRALAPG